MKKRVYTIPPDAPFVDKLAEGLWKQAGGDSFRLADMLVLVPTRRAARHLREAFLRVGKTGAMLLPRMQPVGDLDEDELYFADRTDGNLGIPPAIAPLRRQLLLARLVAARDKDIQPDQAAQLAAALARFLDQAQIARLDFSGLEKLAPANLAEHWKQTLAFLEIVTKKWPEILAQEDGLDPAERRNRVIEAQAAAWRKTPPAGPVIAAGSTGSMPATADLLDVVAGMPKGAVVLPGLDRECDEEAWQAVDESHPQHGMKELLEKFGLRRDQVALWPACKKTSAPRVRLLQETMRPAATTAEWRKLRAADIPSRALTGLARIECENVQEEAQAAALAMRAALEKKDKTAMLVTADRDLAGRVAAALARWGIEADDSAGASLAVQPTGGFLLDVLAAARPEAGAVAWLSLLKHPVTACGLDPASCRAHAREAEIAIWRAADADEKDSKKIRRWFDALKADFALLTQGWRKRRKLADWLDAHLALAERLAASDTETGAERLWRGAAGEAASAWCEEWRRAAHDFPPLAGDDYAALFAGFLHTAIVRPGFGKHPRLSILGPLEARLIHADLVILCGLNEGSWPPEAGIDPWMSRPMKRDFGLPLPERRIGLSAHDFVQLAAAPEVLLTRAKRAGSAPAVPSRFLLQMETVLQALGHRGNGRDALAPKEPWREWVRELDRPNAVTPCDPPAPRPPASSRPKGLRVTEIGTWQRNPYAIYARRILDLEKLEPLDMDASAAERGLVIHRALEIFLKTYPDELPPRAFEELLRIGREGFKAYEKWPQVAAFWWPRFERAAAWLIERERARRGNGIKPLKAEAEGSIALAGGFALRGRADRIDLLPDGTLSITDYKTGAAPSQKEVKSGIEPQLPLLALIAMQGGFAGIPATPVAELAYWKLGGGTEPGIEQKVKEPPGELAEVARAGLEALIARFADPAMPYLAVPRPGLEPRYDDYAHLARLAEWGRSVEDA